MSAAATFAREQLRAPFALALLIAVPAIFVGASAGVLAQFARALGGDLAGSAASALGAGWAAAFIAGTLGFFQATSSKGADRRLALAGECPRRVAASRITASLVLAAVASASAFIALEVRSPVAHPWHAAAALVAFSLIYLAIGVVVGSVIAGPVEGSLAVTFIFLLDVFSGPGMAASPRPYSVSWKAADLLLAAGLGRPSTAADWIVLAGIVTAALAVAFAVFAFSARSRR